MGTGRFDNMRSTPRVVIPPPPRTRKNPVRRAQEMQHGQIEKSVAQPSGAAVPEEADTRHWRASVFSGCSFGGNFTGSTKPLTAQRSLRTSANHLAVRSLRVIVTLPEHLVKSFYPAKSY